MQGEKPTNSALAAGVAGVGRQVSLELPIVLRYGRSADCPGE